jgi:hypothetical protein
MFWLFTPNLTSHPILKSNYVSNINPLVAENFFFEF